MKIIGLSTDNLTVPSTTATAATATSNDASVWLYNNLQKSPNQYSYQTTDLNPIRGDNISRDGKFLVCLFVFSFKFPNRKSKLTFCFHLISIGFGSINSNDDEQNILTMELKLIEQKLMGNSPNAGNTELNKVNKR